MSEPFAFFTKHLNLNQMHKLLRAHHAGDVQLYNSNYTWHIHNSKTRAIVRDSLTCVQCGAQAVRIKEILATRQKKPLTKKGRRVVRVVFETKNRGMLTVDHIKPGSWGGTMALSNLRTMCATCNHQLGTDVTLTKPIRRDRLEWYLKRGFWVRGLDQPGTALRRLSSGKWQRIDSRGKIHFASDGSVKRMKAHSKFIVYPVMGEED